MSHVEEARAQLQASKQNAETAAGAAEQTRAELEMAQNSLSAAMETSDQQAVQEAGATLQAAMALISEVQGHIGNYSAQVESIVL